MCCRLLNGIGNLLLRQGNKGSSPFGSTKNERKGKKMVGRIETYTHSDNTTPNKGGIIVKVECDTDFAAKTPEFIAFCRLVARRAYGASAVVWEDVTNAFPELADELNSLEKLLKEKIRISEIVILRL